MTAAEIRDGAIEDRTETTDTEVMAVNVLVEIAAQLAELNATLLNIAKGLDNLSDPNDGTMLNVRSA